MKTQNAIAVVDAELPASFVEATRRYASAARSPETRRVYETQWKAFVAWCAAKSRVPCPANPATVAAFIAERADRGMSVSTIAQTLTAISEAHKLAGASTPTTDRVVRETWKGIRRTVGVAPKRQAKPIVVDRKRNIDQLRAIIEATPPRLLGLRDRAMILVGFAGAFRRSEIVALDVKDIEIAPEGLRVLVRRSKTDPEGRGASIGISRGTPPTCPVCALEEWLEEAGIVDGPVFRSVDRWENVKGRLLGRDVAIAVQNAVRRAGGAARDFSGHSLRSGLATSAARAGRSVYAIKAQGRWASTKTIDRYVRDVGMFTDNASDGLT